MNTTSSLQSHLPDLYKNNSCDHDLGHILRVVKNAEKIGRLENADLSILLPAAMLHDIALKQGTLPKTNNQHAVLGAQIAKTILEENDFDSQTIGKIISTIRQHSLDNPTNEPRSLEGDCLFDADKLDAISPCGLCRYCQEQALENNLDVVTVALKFKKILATFQFKTKTGQRLGQNRSQSLEFCRAVISFGSL